MMQQPRYHCFLALALIPTILIGICSSIPFVRADENINNNQVEEEDKNIDYDGADLIEWITSNGGFIHPNARIGMDPTGKYRGVFVKSVGGVEGGTVDGIEEDELVCRIPWYVLCVLLIYGSLLFFAFCLHVHIITPSNDCNLIHSSLLLQGVNCQSRHLRL